VSFSLKVKHELAHKNVSRRCCKKVELVALLLSGGTFKLFEEDSPVFSIKAYEPSTTRKIFTLFKNLFQIKCEVICNVEHYFSKKRVYILTFKDRNFKASIGLNLYQDGNFTDIFIALKKLLSKKCCQSSFLRGLFLEIGYVSDPKRDYLIELMFKSKKLANFTSELLCKANFKPRQRRKKNRYIVYMRDSGSFIDFLAFTGASNSALYSTDEKIFKELRSKTNRKVNCETANMERMINAYLDSKKDIEYIKNTIGLDNLPEPLKEIANLRMTHPEIDLKTLGQMLKKPVSKTTVRYRLLKLKALANQIKTKQNH